jgi:hypothetical protein
MKKSVILSVLFICISYINAQTISIIGDFTNWSSEIELNTSDNQNYTLNAYTFTLSGGVKFRQDFDWGFNWGATEFPNGFGVQGGENIPVPVGTYNISFNIISGEYNFVTVSTGFDVIGFLGGFNNFQESINLITANGENYSYTDFEFQSNGVRFRKDNNNDVIWGGTTFPNGTGILGSSEVIPLTNGYYNVSFNNNSFDYNFEIVPISIIGTAVIDWVTDVFLTTQDNGVTYKITTNLNPGQLKFRANATWATNWGTINGTNDGQAILNSPNDITINDAGTYDIVFNRFTRNYCIVSTGEECGIAEGFIVDNDNDGFASDVDCDDNDATVYPGAPELCDGKDNDCNGEIDDNVLLITYYFDNDLDGFGDPNNTIEDCVHPQGYVTNNSDCDDDDPTIYPGAPELCDDKDNDCNGLVDENLATTVYYMDNDGDGYGGGSAGDFCSDPGFGYTLISGDCDDDNNEINPGAIEIPGNGIDENCDGLDEISTSIEVTYQVDITQYLAQGNVLSDDGMRIGGNFADFNATSNGNSMLNWTPIDDASAMANLGNNIWSITVSYPTSFSGQTQFYKFVNGDWGMNEGDLASLIVINGCGNDDGAGNINRTFVIPTLNSTELNCYNTCGNCPELEDNDQDGFTSDVDCDDNDPTVYPGAPELCDG